MKPMPVDEALPCRVSPTVRSHLVAALSLALLFTSSLACGPIEPAAEPSGLAQEHQALETDNGLGLNGLSANGLSANGLSANGLSHNGLSANGLSEFTFTSWFEQNPAHGDMVMRYVVRCAVPAGETRTYTDSQTQLTYTWHGALGLAPGWSSGQPASLVEQQLVSACLAAHVNKYGVSMPISVLGLKASGQPIPFSEEELLAFSYKEACFFGNLFTDEGIFFGLEGPRLKNHESSPRACALSNVDPELRNDCPPLTYVGQCKDLCARLPGVEFNLLCSRNGVTYLPITTRVAQRDIFACGDGVCQFTESCGRGTSPDSCESDCGRCPGDQ